MSVMDQLDNRYERDELTGLLSMDGLIGFIQAEGYLPCKSCCMVYMSIPTFKTLNVSYGYECGNRFLRDITVAIKEILPSGYLARESSHHFVFLIKNMTLDGVRTALSRLQEQIIRIPRGDRMVLKAGLTDCATKLNVFEEIDRARQACFYAERHKVSFQIFNEQVSKELQFQQYLLSNFETACSDGNIQPFYQPHIRTLSKECCGFEALARWIDPKYGIISPGVFIPLFEQENLIHKLDLHIIRTVCSDLKQAIDACRQVVPVSVNLSRVDFRMMDVIKEIELCREEFNIPRRLLHIEITESAVAEAEEYMASIIDQFRELGYQIWMDDFGSGYSSLNNLQMYHFDVLKIDLLFLKQLPDNPRTRIIIASVINMAKRLGLVTLAEGVETQEQYDFLLEVGCEMLQGYLFGKPVKVNRSDVTNPFVDESMNNLPLETLARRSYYSHMGRINLLSSTPMEEEVLQEKNKIPISIIETTDEGGINFLFGNEAYLRFLRNVGIEDLSAAQIRGNKEYLAENTSFLRFARRAEAAGKTQGELLINGILLSTEIMFIARDSNKAAFLTIIRMLKQNDDQKQSEGIQLAEQYVLSAYFRVDLFDENKTAINLYLDADQRKLTDLDSDATTLVRQYAERYIASDESQAFCDFYNMDTVLERIKKSGGHHVSKYFHSAIPGEEGRLQKYTIMPFRFRHRWLHLSCCQYVETPPEEIILELLENSRKDH